MAKMIAFDQEAREAIRRGVSKLARAVKAITLSLGWTNTRVSLLILKKRNARSAV